MEIAPAPRRPWLSPRARVLLVLAVFAPVTALALVPTMFGLQRYVVASESMGGGFDRGSVVLERRVPISDIEVGDVITYAPPADAGIDGLITHRVVGIDGTDLRTQGDARSSPDPWPVPLDGPTVSRVVVAIPYVGLPFVAPVGDAVWLLALVVPGSVLALLLVQDALRARQRRTSPSPSIGTSPR
ncbi:MAG: signal peptidase I [Nocardioides sp.]|nr:signal peptidase I [Nocardioides sp.]